MVRAFPSAPWNKNQLLTAVEESRYQWEQYAPGVEEKNAEPIEDDKTPTAIASHDNKTRTLINIILKEV